MAEVIMPKMGDAMTEGRIIRWIKQPGDAVVKGEPIAEIETDKVNVELEAEAAGALTHVLVPAGAVAAVGAVIAVIAQPGEHPAAGAAAPGTAAEPPDGAVPSPAAPPMAAATVRASPLARRLAEQHRIPLNTVKGTGPDGRITKEDVEAAAAAATRQVSVPPVPAPVAPLEPGAKDVPLTRMRQTIARRMAESKQQVPHIYLTVAVEMDAALALRKQINDGLGEAARISVNDMVVRATALALTRFAGLNASFVGQAVRQHADINISVGVALPDGLLAPTIYHCDAKSLWEIARDSRALAERARSGRLHSEDLTGGTFTVSNLGMFGVDVFSAIINPPQAAILAVGAAKPSAVVRDGQVAVATIMQLTCAADHRVSDGAEVARFLAEVKRLLENPVWLVAHPQGS